MKILFTKTGIEHEVSEKLETGFSFDFKDLISTEITKVKAFDLTGYSLIFTSQNAVNAFFENGFQSLGQEIYTVGEKTAAVLKSNNLSVKKNCKNADELCQYLLNEVKKGSFLHFCGNLVLETLEKNLKSPEFNYKKLEVYSTKLLSPELNESYDAVVFFSPSGVRSFATHQSFDGKKLFAIGETTANEIKNYTESKIIVSDKNNLDDLLNRIKQESEGN